MTQKGAIFPAHQTPRYGTASGAKKHINKNDEIDQFGFVPTPAFWNTHTINVESTACTEECRNIMRGKQCASGVLTLKTQHSKIMAAEEFGFASDGTFSLLF